ncbi:hypothetical protein BgiBS90_032208 [Biomphalaria glabrata]|nr:hypothetical protein BgiBS90_032208 [Biomphalaria glabrata]
MSDLGEDDGKSADWIREVSDDSDNENGACMARKYYSEYSRNSSDLLMVDEDDAPRWTGSEAGFRRTDSPIISNMEDYHAGPEFEERSNWMTGEPELGAHRSTSETDHNENHLINIDYRGGEAFCDSDIMSSDQSLSDYEQNDGRWSSSESSKKNETGHTRIVQHTTECAMPRDGMPVFSRSAETARSKLDHTQRPDRLYTRRQAIRKRIVSGDQSVGQTASKKSQRRIQIKIKGSKSCTTESEIIKPNADKNYPRPDRTKFSSLYEEILRSEDFAQLAEDYDNGEDDYSDFGDDGPVSEITGLDTSESKSESSRKRVSVSSVSSRTGSSEESLRDGAVPGGKVNSVTAAEISPQRLGRTMTPTYQTSNSGRNQAIVDRNFELLPKNLETVRKKNKPTATTASKNCSGFSNKNEKPLFFNVTLAAKLNIHGIGSEEEVSNFNESSRSAAQAQSSKFSLESSGAHGFLNNVLEQAYMNTLRKHEFSSKDNPTDTNASPNVINGADRVEVTANISQPTSISVRGDSALEKQEVTVGSGDTVNAQLLNAENESSVKAEYATSETIALEQHGDLNVEKQAEDLSVSKEESTHHEANLSTVKPQISKAEDGLNYPNSNTAEEAVECSSSPPAHTQRQYYMSFLNVLRNKKLINKKVRRPPQKFFKLLHSKPETSQLKLNESNADFRETSSTKDKCNKMPAKHFPKGREVPPGWKPGQYSTASLGNKTAGLSEPSPKKKTKKTNVGKSKPNMKGCNNNKKRQVLSDVSVNDMESEESVPARTRRPSDSSESSASTESKHTLGYGERYNPHSEESTEMEQRGKKTFGQEFETKRQYYERLTKIKKKTTGGAMDRRYLTSQVKFLKTIDEFCSAEDYDHVDYDSYEDCSGSTEFQLDSVDYHISLAQYYSGRPSNMQIIKGAPPSELMQGCAGVRIRKAQNNVPSAMDTERLKSLYVDESNSKGKLGMWSLNTLYAHKVGISEIPRESNLSLLSSFAESKDDTVDPSLSLERKIKTKQTRKRGLERNREFKQGKYRSVKTSHLEKLAVFESERKVTYLDVLKSGYSSKLNKASRENNVSDTQQIIRRETPTVQKSKSCENPGNKFQAAPFQKETSPPADPESPRRLKLVRFNEPKALEDGKATDQVDRSEEDTWCYSVNAMLLRANQALEQQKTANDENEHHFPRPESAKVVAPVVKPMSSSFLSELLEQDKEEQKIVKQSQKLRRSELSKSGEDQIQGKKNINNNDNTNENRVIMSSFSVPLALLSEVKPSSALTNIAPCIQQATNYVPEAPKHSAGILKIKTTVASKKPKERLSCREQKTFLGDFPASMYFSTTQSQPNIPPKKLLPLRYVSPLDASTQIGAKNWTPVRILKESLGQRVTSDNLEPKQQIGENLLATSKVTPKSIFPGLKFKPADHRVSTIVQMFSDFNNSANSDGSSLDQDDYFDQLDLPSDVSGQETRNESVRTQSVQSSSVYTTNQSSIESNTSMVSSTKIEQHSIKSGDISLTVDRYKSNSEIEDKRSITSLSLTYGVRNDPDALRIEGVMGFLGKSQKCSEGQRSSSKPHKSSGGQRSSSKPHKSSRGQRSRSKPRKSSRGQRSSSKPHKISFTDHASLQNLMPYSESPDASVVNINGMDSLTFISAALQYTDNDDARARVAQSNAEIIEYCQRNEESLAPSEPMYTGVWDPNYLTDYDQIELLAACNQINFQEAIQSTQTDIATKEKHSEQSQNPDSGSREEKDEHKQIEQITSGLCDANSSKPTHHDLEPFSELHITTSSRDYTPERTREYAGNKSDERLHIAQSTMALYGYHCLNAKSKQDKRLPRKDIPRKALKPYLFEFGIDNSVKGFQTNLREMKSANDQKDHTDKENVHLRQLEGTCNVGDKSRSTVYWEEPDFNRDELQLQQPNSDKVGDPCCQTAENFGHDTFLSAHYDKMGDLTGSDLLLTNPQENESVTKSSAPCTKESHTTEIIDVTDTDLLYKMDMVRVGEDRQDMSTASQFSDFAVDDTLSEHPTEKGKNKQAKPDKKYTPSDGALQRNGKDKIQGSLELTVANSSCIVYKRIGLSPDETNIHRHWNPNKEYLRLLRGSDLLQTVAQDKQRLSTHLQSLVRVVNYIPAFQIRSLQPPEMIPVVLQIRRCGSESMDDVELKEGVQTIPVFYLQEKGSILESVFTVYYLRPGVYSMETLEEARQDYGRYEMSPFKARLFSGRLSLFSPVYQINVETIRQLYVFGTAVATYDKALNRLAEIYDEAKLENDAGIYFNLTCGWAPKHVLVKGRELHTLKSYCHSCTSKLHDIFERQDEREGNETTDNSVKMCHGTCDKCGRCVASFPLMKNIEGDVKQHSNGWMVDRKGLALPINTKPKVKCASTLALPRLRAGKGFDARHPPQKEGQRLTFSLPPVTARAALLETNAVKSTKPKQSISSPNMYTETWWWGEIEQQRRREMDNFKKDIRENFSEVELVIFTDDVRSKQKQRLQEIKEEMRMQRQSPVSEQKELLDIDHDPPPSLAGDHAPIRIPNNETLCSLSFSSESDHSYQKKAGDASYLHKDIPIPPASPIKKKQNVTEPSMQLFSNYFQNLAPQNKATWVRDYLEPPPRAYSGPAKSVLPKNRDAKSSLQRVPSKLPPMSRDKTIRPRKAAHLQTKPSLLLKHSRVQKGNKKPRKSSSLSSTNSDERSGSSRSTSMSSLTDADSTKSDFLAHYKKIGGPTSIEDIFSRTLPLLRKTQYDASTAWRRKLLESNKLDAEFMEGDEFLKSLGSHLPETCNKEQGDAADTFSTHSEASTLHEFDLCDDADEMRELWKLVFPEVNFWDRKRRCNKYRKRSVKIY